MYFDAHIHLIDENILIDAQKKGIQSFVVNATNPNEWEQVITLANKVNNVYPCIGIHPWFIDDNLEPNWAERMETLLKQNPFLMVGEIGLDYLKPNKELQLKIFNTCLNLAQKYNRPTHIHIVKAWHDMLGILKKNPNGKFLFHQFNAPENIIQKLEKYDVFFSVSTNKNLNLIPFEKLLVETDSPTHNKTPCDIINIVENFGLNKDQLFQNFQKFIEPINHFIPLKD